MPVHGKLEPGEGVMLETFVEDCLLWEGTLDQGKTLKSPLLAEKGVSRVCDEVTTLLRVEKLGVKLSLGRKGKDVFRIFVLFLLSYSD